MDLRFEAIGSDKPLGDTGKIASAIMAAVRDTANEGTRIMTEYPPQRKTWYVRTGKLRSSWSSNVSNSGGSIIGEVGSNANIAPYNEQVQ